MANCGPDARGFYSYFKSSLYAEVLGCFFTDPNWKSNWEGIDIDMKAPQVAPQIVRAYLSRQRFEDVRAMWRAAVRPPSGPSRTCSMRW